MRPDKKVKRKGSALAAAPPPVRTLLVEHLEEEELPAMEAVLRYCYTPELCDVGGDASELSVALLVHILVLSDIVGIVY